MTPGRADHCDFSCVPVLVRVCTEALGVRLSLFDTLARCVRSLLPSLPAASLPLCRLRAAAVPAAAATERHCDSVCQCDCLRASAAAVQSSATECGSMCFSEPFRGDSVCSDCLLLAARCSLPLRSLRVCITDALVLVAADSPTMSLGQRLLYRPGPVAPSPFLLARIMSCQRRQCAPERVHLFIRGQMSEEHSAAWSSASVVTHRLC